MSFNTPNRAVRTRFSLLDQARKRAGVAWPKHLAEKLDAIDNHTAAELPAATDLNIAAAFRAAKGDPLNDKNVQRLLLARVAADLHIGEWRDHDADRERIEAIRQHRDELLAAFSAVVAEHAPAIEAAHAAGITDLKTQDDMQTWSAPKLVAFVAARTANDLIRAALDGFALAVQVGGRGGVKHPAMLADITDPTEAHRLRFGAEGVNNSPLTLVALGYKLDMPSFAGYKARLDALDAERDRRAAEEAGRRPAKKQSEWTRIR